MVRKFGVYLTDELYEKLQEYVNKLGVRSKSKLLQEALRLFIVEHQWKLGGNVVGLIGIVYDHEYPDVDNRLTDVQHRYISLIVSTVHIHLDERKCMLAIIVRGDAERIRKLLNDLMNIRGVLLTRQILLPVE
ncbi:MAG TPA: CopG family ribbon-helix-helix protein [Candidatus Bathyarchaeota archaeon]|nr:CopG family ribbon-helix-helix protein [Candidatus Bathyarchaeota archaeon]